MRINDLSSDLCSSYLGTACRGHPARRAMRGDDGASRASRNAAGGLGTPPAGSPVPASRGVERPCPWARIDRKSGVKGKSVSVSVALGGGRILKKKYYNQ